MLNKKIRIVLGSIGLLFGAAVVAQNRPAFFYFGGKKIFVGMGQSGALAVLATCCKLSPPKLTESQKEMGAGQFIVPNEESPGRILGSIHFENGKVARVTRPLGDDAYIAWNSDVLGFARTLERALSPTSGDAENTVRISVHHERASNGDTESLSFSFPNGRGVRLSLIRLDRPLEGAPEGWSKEQATLDEFLEQP
jgi:hypothetical protein